MSDTGTVTGGGSSDIAGRSGRGGCGRGNHYGRGGGQSKGSGASQSSIKPKYKGQTEEIKDHVFELSTPNTSALFAESTKKLANYVGMHYTQGADIKVSIEQGFGRVVITQPVYPATTLGPPDATGTTPVIQPSPGEVKMWKSQMHSWVKRTEKMEENIHALFSLIWGQCAEDIQAKVEAQPEWPNLQISQDGLELLKTVEKVMLNYQTHKYIYLTNLEMRNRKCYQGALTPAEYLIRFKAHIRACEAVGVNFGSDNILWTKELNPANQANPTAGQTAVAMFASKNKYIAMEFLMCADKKRYGKLLKDLENNFTFGRGHYPKNLDKAYALLINWKSDPRNMIPAAVLAAGSTGVAFAQASEESVDIASTNATTFVNPSDGSGRVTHPNVQCHECGEWGHYKSACPKILALIAQAKVQLQQQPNKMAGVTKTTVGNICACVSTESLMGPKAGAETKPGTLHALVEDFEEDDTEDLRVSLGFLTKGIDINNVGYQCGEITGVAAKISEYGPVPRTWILLDNQSTVDVFCNKDLVKNICPSKI